MVNYELKKGVIYKLTSPNGKVYIGQTINVNQRKKKYKYKKFNGQIKLWLDCEKYHWNPIDYFEIIEECECGKNKSIINEREIYWIYFYDSFNNGLNCNNGGNGNLGKKVSDETKKKISQKIKEHWNTMTDEQKEIRNSKISEFSKNRIHTTETIEKIKKTKKDNPFIPDDNFKRKISESLMGKPGRNTGNKHSVETKKKISESKNGIENKKLFKKIYCITNNEIYDSIKSAANVLGLNRSKISAVCSGKRLTTGGYKFKYYE